MEQCEFVGVVMSMEREPHFQTLNLRVGFNVSGTDQPEQRDDSAGTASAYRSEDLICFENKEFCRRWITHTENSCKTQHRTR